ncbi:50S ribosomal protein L5 [Candidatus Saccharibacteria bacterium]|nr:50S ribosomal protein L5 [Candidatus Saccharibacteria bacterium]
MAKAATASTPAKYQSRLKVQYNDQITKELKDELKLANIWEVPRLEKIVINAGLGRAKDDKKLLEVAGNTISKITGQKPVETTARMSIASFKLREGNKIGTMVTLRGDRMYEFADRFINIILPRMRDFRGVSEKSFDKQGNYTIGLIDQSVFPELSFEETSTAHGLQVIFNIKAQDPAHARALLEKLGMPFERRSNDG